MSLRHEERSRGIVIVRDIDRKRHRDRGMEKKTDRS